MNQDKVVLYAHAGSGNHGCEALANTICKLVKKPVLLVTNSVEEDKNYSLEPNDVIIIRKHEMHRIFHNSNKSYRRLSIMVSPDFFKLNACENYELAFLEESFNIYKVLTTPKDELYLSYPISNNDGVAKAVCMMLLLD